jgi:hypothetical protein
MVDMSSLGKTLILFGIVLIAIGALFSLGGKLSWFGRLPGDIYIQRKNFTFFFPITTSIILGILLSLALIFLRKR